VGIAPQPPGSLPRSNTWNRGALCSLTARREGKRATRGLRHRAANRLDHVTLTPGATALAVATDTLWVPSGTKANLAPQHRMGGLRMSMYRSEDSVTQGNAGEHRLFLIKRDLLSGRSK
jgi:hypothetical protein